MPVLYRVRMTGDDLEDYALAKPGAWRDTPWDGDVVAKVEHPTRRRPDPR
jgi:hypothetical protein